MFQPQFPVEAATRSEPLDGSWRTREHTCPTPHGSCSSSVYTPGWRFQNPCVMSRDGETPARPHTDHSHIPDTGRPCRPALSGVHPGAAVERHESDTRVDRRTSDHPPPVHPFLTATCSTD